jgi:hypothetical protein
MKKKRREKFAKGTKVKWCGEYGIVTDDFGDRSDHPIFVKFESGPFCSSTFTREGRYCKWHKKPSLKVR